MKLSVSQHSSKGRKAINQDRLAYRLPDSQYEQDLKGAIFAMADGISSSDVSHTASHLAVEALVTDYYSTSDAWRIKQSVRSVVEATNRWLYAQSHGLWQHLSLSEKDKGYVCTLASVIIKASQAHVFHVGDTRVYHVHQGEISLLTQDHRYWANAKTSYLSRAMGVENTVELDYCTVRVSPGDLFLLMTDGVYDYVSDDDLLAWCQASLSDTLRHGQSEDFASLAERVVNHALAAGSDDNLSVQVVRVDAIDVHDISDYIPVTNSRPLPLLSAGDQVDGYRVIQPLSHTSRSHLYLVEPHTQTDGQQAQQKTWQKTQQRDKSPCHYVLKTPSLESLSEAQGHCSEYINRFFTEEWIASHMRNRHLLSSPSDPKLKTERRSHLYTLYDYMPGMTLTSWLDAYPDADIAQKIDLLVQIGTGLQAMHRQQILHQDLRADNILVNDSGHARIIDYGSAVAAGMTESTLSTAQDPVPGKVSCMAPEYFLGSAVTTAADVYALGALAYYMFTRSLPYGLEVSKISHPKALQQLQYHDIRGLPHWINQAIKKAVHPVPHERFQEPSEFVYALKQSSPVVSIASVTPPLLQKNPVKFWQGTSLVLFLMVIYLLWHQP